MRRILLVLIMIVAAVCSFAQAPGDDAALRAAMNAQVVAWNKGDVAGFMQAYENSPETTFVGSSVNKGYESILKRYQAKYTNSVQMGTLTFSNLQVRRLPGSYGAVEYAVMTGNFHLERTQKGAATKDDGIFSLVWHKGPDGWKIVLDHTS